MTKPVYEIPVTYEDPAGRTAPAASAPPAGLLAPASPLPPGFLPTDGAGSASGLQMPPPTTVQDGSRRGMREAALQAAELSSIPEAEPAPEPGFGWVPLSTTNESATTTPSPAEREPAEAMPSFTWAEPDVTPLAAAADAAPVMDAVPAAGPDVTAEFPPPRPTAEFPPPALAAPAAFPLSASFPVSAPFFAAPPVPVMQPPVSDPMASPPPRAAEVLSMPAPSNLMEPLLASTAGADRGLLAALQEVLRETASDLHVASKAVPMLRIDGGLRPISTNEFWDAERVRSALLSIITPHQQAIFEEVLELDFAYGVSENARFRVNFSQDRGNLAAAFRLIPTEIKPLSELGIPESVGKFSTLPRGLVLVTGPTGSGKSTTLAALVDMVNRSRADHIVTVEDPIEFMHTNKKSLVNQREVGHDTHSFNAALKHVLRQDPDVILVGELRDLETISVALTAAETGHLVFATLHTQDAAQTVDRIIDVFPPFQQGQVRAQLAATLQGVVCQTLVKRASGRGRVVATEIMVITSAISNLIREGKTFQIASAMQAGRALGMHTMDQHLADLVNAGEITHRAALDKAHDVESIKRLIHRTEGEMTGSTMASVGIDFHDAYSVQETRS